MKKSIILPLIFLGIITTSFVNVPLIKHQSQQEEAVVKNAEVISNNKKDIVEIRTYKTKFSNDKNNQVRIEVYQSAVQVVGHNSDEVLIETDTYHLPERAGGLRSLFSQVEDNTDLGMAVIEEKNLMRIVQASRRGGSYIIKVPKKVAVIYHEVNASGGKFSLSDTEGAVDLKLHHGNATLTNITGPVNAQTIHGRLDIKFSELNQAQESSINSVHGPVDITLPGNTKADFELSSHHGEIYTDFDLNRARDEKEGLTKVAGSNTIKGKTNNGGVALNISAVHSDIFIRKQK